MNESFILHTIYRHLERYELTPSGPVNKLTKVPKPVLNIVYKLSKLAFNGLQENKLVFTFDEVKEVCPHVDETVGAINGFGLLQAVQHYPSEGAGTTTSLNFLHYTMQEFLSALHVSNLPSEQQSSLMNETFWDGHYNFMWMMFVGIVGIKSDIFVNFVSKGKEYKRKSGIRMAENILSDKRKRLHVFQCYMEAKSSAEAPDVISDMFKNGKISINGVKLLPHHISSLMTYVSNSSMQWNTLQLYDCNITDIGMSVLEQFISDNTTFGYVDLRDNKSSPWGVYCAIIRHCSVDSLTLCGDHGIEDYVNKIKDCLQMNTKLISLTLCNITNNGVISISEAIQGNTTLQIFDLSNNSIYDDGATAIGDSLKHYISLQQLNISCNNITDKGIKVVAEAIRMNSTLRNINISKNHISTEGILYFMEAVKKNCTLQVVNITHNNVTRSGFTSIKQCINNLQYPIQIIASWNEIVSRSEELLVKSVICTLEESEGITEDVWSFEDYDHDYIVTCLCECFKEDDILIELNLSKNKIMRDREKKIVEAIKINKTLQKLDASHVKIHEGLTSDLLKISKSLKELNISNNGITSDGAKEIATAISVNKTLEKLDLSCSMLSDDGVTFISDALKNNINSALQNINISKNHISTEGLLYFMEAVKNNCTLQVVNITHNNITRSGFNSIKQCIEDLPHPIQIIASWNEIRGGKLVTKISTSCAPGNIEEDVWSHDEYDGDHLVMCLSECLKEDNMVQKIDLHGYYNKNITSEGVIKIVEAINVNKTLQELYITGNNISDDGAAAISDALKGNNSLQILKMSYNNITSEGAIKIAEAIKVNKTLQELDISNNNISDDGAAAISDALKSNNSLQMLKMSENKTTSVGVKLIAEAIKVNTTLQNLDISENNILNFDDGAAAIGDALKSNSSLQILDMSYNNITSEGAKLIAEGIKVNTTLHTLYLSHYNINDRVSFNMLVLTAVYHNNTLMKLTLPRVYDDDERLVRSEVEKINKERTRQGISALTCDY